MRLVDSLLDLSAASGTENALDVTVDGELAGGEGADHDNPRTETEVETAEPKLLGKAKEARNNASAAALLLVDLREQRVGGLRDDGRRNSRNETAAKVDGHDHAVAQLLLGRRDRSVDGLRGALVHDELGHRVGDLLEENGEEARVEAADHALLTCEAGEAANESVGEGRLRHKANARGLQRAQRNVCEKLGNRRRCKVHGSAVVRRKLHAKVVNRRLLPELVASELEGSLEEVSGKGWADTGKKSTGTLLGDNLLEAIDHALVVDCGLELDAGLDDVDGSEGTVCDGAADGTGKGEAGVEVNSLGGIGSRRSLRGGGNEAEGTGGGGRRRDKRGGGHALDVIVETHFLLGFWSVTHEGFAGKANPMYSA
eukprot:Opistho-2@76835